MQTMLQAAKKLNIPKGTVRQWVKDFNGFMSDSTRPGEGEVKLLDDDDIAVLWTVAYLRAQRKSKDYIAAELEKGERYFPQETIAESETTAAPGDGGHDGQPAEDAEEKTESTALITEAFRETLQTYEGLIGSLTDKLVDAEKRAERYKTLYESVTSQPTVKPPESQPPPVDDTPGDDIETDDETAVIVEDNQPAAAHPLTFGQRLKILFTGKS